MSFRREKRTGSGGLWSVVGMVGLPGPARGLVGVVAGLTVVAIGGGFRRGGSGRLGFGRALRGLVPDPDAVHVFAADAGRGREKRDELACPCARVVAVEARDRLGVGLVAGAAEAAGCPWNRAVR